MSKIKELVKSPHVQISFAAGISIITLAYFSKRVLPEPIGYLPLAIPPFIATIFEAMLDRHKDSWFCRSEYWVVAIFVATALVITFYAV
jgi:predicted histidine transporter YuiF (NhaC family)